MRSIFKNKNNFYITTVLCTTVDDFGVGYSSLNLIRELPWDVIKIDKSLLSEREDDIHGRMMFNHIVSMAKEFGIRCIAEGVETLEHVHVLKECNCMMAQGFYFDKPLPVEEFEKRLDNKGVYEGKLAEE